jgi:hypothetical protein
MIGRASLGTPCNAAAGDELPILSPGVASSHPGSDAPYSAIPFLLTVEDPD